MQGMRTYDPQKLTQSTWDMVPFTERTGVVIEHGEPGYVRLRMPFEGNVNHVGMMCAGALFTLAEVPGGAIFTTTFDFKRFYPLVKEMTIRYRRPAMTDITAEVRLSAEEATRISDEAERVGKADYGWECELVDTSGEVVAVSKNTYQLRRIESRA